MSETNSKFYTGDLTNSTIENANLNETTIRYANMKKAQIIHVDLTGSTVRASNLSEVRVEGNAWWDMRMNQCDVFGLNFDTGTLENAIVSNSHLVNLTMLGIEFNHSANGYDGTIQHDVEKVYDEETEL